MSMEMSILGTGVAGAFGCGWPDLVTAVQAEGSCSKVIPVPNAVPECSLSAYVVDPSPVKQRLKPAQLRRADRFSRLVTLGAILALEDGGLEQFPRERVGVVLTTGYGANATSFQFVDSIMDFGDVGASPILFSGSGHSGGVSVATILLGITGPALTICQPELAFHTGLVTANQWLAEGRVDLALLIAVEEFCPLLLYGFHKMFGSSPVIQPFDWAKQSAAPGEGVACLALSRPGLPQGKEIARIGGQGFGEPEKGVGPLVVGADGMACNGLHYERIIQSAPVFAPAATYGSMPTGIAFGLTAALGLARKGESPHPSRCQGLDPQAFPTAEPFRLVECGSSGLTAWSDVRISSAR